MRDCFKTVRLHPRGEALTDVLLLLSAGGLVPSVWLHDDVGAVPALAVTVSLLSLTARVQQLRTREKASARWLCVLLRSSTKHAFPDALVLPRVPPKETEAATSCEATQTLGGGTR